MSGRDGLHFDRTFMEPELRDADLFALKCGD